MSGAIKLLRRLVAWNDGFGDDDDRLETIIDDAAIFLASPPSDRDDLVRRLRDWHKDVSAIDMYDPVYVALIKEAADALSEKALPEVTTNDQQQPEK